GFGFEMLVAGGVTGLPIPSLQKTASPNIASEWLAPVPPITDWCMLSLMLKLLASIVKNGMSPLCTLVNAIELPTPLSDVENEVATNGNRSLRQPLGLAAVALASEQSACCHIW